MTKLESVLPSLFLCGLYAEGIESTEPSEDRGGGRTAKVDRNGCRDGRPPARDLRLRVLHQESTSPGFRQPAEGPAHVCEGGRRQRPRRVRGGRNPPRRDRQGGGRRQRR